MKILAVDDEPFILEMIPLLAAQVGFPDVKTACSGEAALKVLADVGPVFDCMIFDINMPGLDGIELCRAVRKITGCEQTPIIMLTAMSDRKFVDLAFQAGATDYATKPFDLTELGARLRLANELVAARREAEMLRKGPLAPPQQADAADIAGVPKLTNTASLKNYLKQLSRAGATSSQIVAFGIDRIDCLKAKATADELQYALREIASAIGDVMASGLALMSHSGNGVFLVVSSATMQLNLEEIESDIQYALDERNLQYDNAEPMNFEIFMGSAVRPMSGNGDDVERSIERALARLEARIQAGHTPQIRPNIR